MQAVIGAGAAGLVAARELVLAGHHVTVFEKGSSTGGVWVYTDEVESPDLLGMHRLYVSVCILMDVATLIMVTHMSACANPNACSICFTAYWLDACICSSIPSAQLFVRKEHASICLFLSADCFAAIAVWLRHSRSYALCFILLFRSDQDTWALLQVKTQKDTRFTAACMRDCAPTYLGKLWPTQTLLLMTWLDRAKILADSLPMTRYIDSD